METRLLELKARIADFLECLHEEISPLSAEAAAEWVLSVLDEQSDVTCRKQGMDEKNLLMLLAAHAALVQPMHRDPRESFRICLEFMESAVSGRLLQSDKRLKSST